MVMKSSIVECVKTAVVKSVMKFAKGGVEPATVECWKATVEPATVECWKPTAEPAAMKPASMKAAAACEIGPKESASEKQDSCHTP
jgi:hypothetical protein